MSHLPPEEKLIPTSCVHNCSGRCFLHAHVKDGKLIRLSPGEEGPDSPDCPQTRACLRGLAQRHWLDHPDRLQYPLKRVGKRGEGHFQRISWDEAITAIAAEMTRIKEAYGNAAMYLNYGTGVYGQISQSWIDDSSRGALPRFFNLFGGFLGYYNTYSAACYSAAAPYTFGEVEGQSPDDLLNAGLIVLFADNPAETRMGGANIPHYLSLAKERGAKIIVIDPRHSDTAASLADKWIPVKPTTDNALMAALAYVLISEELVDQAFLDQYCLGFDEAHMPPGIPAGQSYKSYIMGLGEDKIAKSPAWAEAVTGVPREDIVSLAREIGLTKPCALVQGLGWQRHAYGEQAVRALPVLAAMTGNIGREGGGPGLRPGGHKMPMGWMPAGTNPVKARISCFTWTDAIRRGQEMTAADGVKGAKRLPANIKMIWNYASNTLINQHADINATAKLLADERQCEFIVLHDLFMTPSAKFADIVLPDVSHFEREDIVTFSAGIAYAIYHRKVREPMYECRSVYDVCSALAGKLGFAEAYTGGKTEQDWLRECVREAQRQDAEFPDFEEFRRIGIYKKKPARPIIAYERQIRDVSANPFATPSGRIEIFSPRLWEMNNPLIPAIPKYLPAWEGPDDQLAERFPLQCIGYHSKRRVHSTFDNLAVLEEAVPQEIWLNPGDAGARGLQSGEKARVFNDRGEVVIPVKVTPRVRPGVVAIPQGAWWQPDTRGIDHRGNINTLTKYQPTPLAFGNPQHTNLVEVVKWEGDAE
ncbi:DMSO/selenate family reductase complex A subunit [Sporomusa aerivorans]|uniref:DMSO/selenate family reductase complex A subunit n=1 Tax=Sporomusa aerivorans TaxID=204936 RepID=UPI00352AF1F1